MRTMNDGPCPYYDCSNRNSFGYCKTTACINKYYQQEQWNLPLIINKSESVVIKPQTNADRIRSMTDEELADLLGSDPWCDAYCWTDGVESSCRDCILEWLKKESE